MARCPSPFEELTAASPTASLILLARREERIYGAIRDGWYRGRLIRQPGAAVRGARDGYLWARLLPEDALNREYSEHNRLVREAAEAADWAAIVVGLGLPLE